MFVQVVLKLLTNTLLFPSHLPPNCIPKLTSDESNVGFFQRRCSQFATQCYTAAAFLCIIKASNRRLPRPHIKNKINTVGVWIFYKFMICISIRERNRNRSVRMPVLYRGKYVNNVTFGPHVGVCLPLG